MTATRRTFLRSAIGTAGLVSIGLPGTGAAASPVARSAAARGRRPSIERIAMLTVPGRFHRPIAMNAYDDRPKGQITRVRMCRIVLSDGTEGIGVMGYVRPDESQMETLRDFIGVDPDSFYQWDGDGISGVTDEMGAMLIRPEFAWLESAVLDAIGRQREQPVWSLVGTSVREGVDCYDGSLYFADVRDKTGPERIGELAEEIADAGYRAIKMKVGRIGKWMPGEAGLQRDIECVIAAREAVGYNFNLMTDANNGYGGEYDAALQFLKKTSPYELYWIEEIFPENRERYARLRRDLLDAGVVTRVAEGESAMFSGQYRSMGEFEPWMRDHLFDVIQPDMRTIGFSHALRAAELASHHGKTFVPHNWNSEIGKLMSIHLSRIRSCVTFVEDDRWSNDAIDASGYQFRGGRWYAPDAPGWGIALTEAYDHAAREGEELIIQ